LKIGVFHPPIHPKYFGGSVAVTVPIVNELAENGYEVVLFVKDSIDQKKISEMMGERISPLVKTILKPARLEPRSLLDLYECAFKLLSLKMKCDLVIDTYSNYVFPWTNICYIHFPYINTSRFKQRFPYLKKRKGFIADIINLPHVFYEKNFERYDEKLLLANSRFTSEAIKESLKVTAKVLYPPVSTLFFQNDFITSKGDQRENLVVTIGRITEDKKMETIPQIANLLHEENIKFIIIGFAYDESALRKINTEIKRLNLNEKVIILTDASKEEIKKILERAKVYLHPPVIEHFGISIAEAMALGCIPVVYNIGGVKEFVPEEFRYENLHDAAEKVEKAIDRWSLKQARRMNSITQRFAEPNFRKNFIKIFSEYCSQRE